MSKLRTRTAGSVGDGSNVVAPRVAQFGVPFSPNLGDGLISECLCFGLKALFPGLEFVAVDLSGRQKFGDITVRNRMLLIKLLNALPAPMRQELVKAQLARVLDNVLPQWAESVTSCDFAIVGGGQLFSDVDLNFCMKIAGASRIIRQEGLPAVVYAAGVARNWSPRGAQLFAELARSDLRFVGVRDLASMTAWTGQMAKLAATPDPVLTRDPGLLAAECYGRVDTTSEIGIGVTSPEIITYHSDERSRNTQNVDFFCQVSLKVADAGHRVALFCNGAVEDSKVLDRLSKMPQISGRDDIRVIAPPARPADLARMIGGFRAVIAHRLHACITGYSYAVPIVGLGWDSKLESFFDSVGLSQNFIAAADLEPDRVASTLDAALSSAGLLHGHASVVDETWDGLRKMLEAGLGRSIDPMFGQEPTAP